MANGPSIEEALGDAFRLVRQAKGLTQEDFVPVSGRTYISELELAKKNPTLSKLDALSNHMKVHPLTIVTFAYLLHQNLDDPSEISDVVAAQLQQVVNN